MDKNFNLHQVSPFEMDIMREVGNIGSGNAMTALSILLNKRLEMDIAEVHIEKGPNVLSILGDEENYVSSTIVEVFGDIEGMLIMSLEKESALNLINHVNQASDLEKAERKEVHDLDDVDFSILGEFGNILAGSYLRSLNMMTGLNLNQSLPQTAIDMAGAILSYPVLQFSNNNDELIFVRSIFKDDSGLLKGSYILILSEDTFEKIISSIEGKC